MNLYIATEKQEQLMSLNFNIEELSYREKKSITRLQIVSYHGRKVIKSIHDKFMKIRIAIAALLIKIYSKFNSQHQFILNQFKQIVYSAQLPKLTTAKGIEKEQLLKSVADHLYKLGISYDAQREIIKLFNNAPFFDEILMNACVQSHPQLLEKDDQVIRDWMKKSFQIEIKWREESIIESNDELLLVGIPPKTIEKKEGRNFQEYLKYSVEELLNDSESDEANRSNKQKTDSNFDDNKLQNEEFMLVGMESSSLTPRLYSNSAIKLLNKLSAQAEAHKVENDLVSRSKKKSEGATKNSDVIKIRRMESDNRSTFWRIFCCQTL